MQKPKIVLVEWEDACSLDSEAWADAEPVTKYTPLTMSSVGYVLYDGPEGLILTSTFSESCFAPRDQIPRGMIRSITLLKEAESKKNKK